jgi:hypothetical protein
LRNFLGGNNQILGLNRGSGVARRRASVETEIFHELPIILVDRCGHVIGPMIIAFVHLLSPVCSLAQGVPIVLCELLLKINKGNQPVPD